MQEVAWFFPLPLKRHLKEVCFFFSPSTRLDSLVTLEEWHFEEKEGERKKKSNVGGFLKKEAAKKTSLTEYVEIKKKHFC